MAAAFFSRMFDYFNAWLIMGSTLAIALASEKAYLLASSAIGKRKGVPTPERWSIRHSFMTEVSLPESAPVKCSLYCPALAFASLMTLCASIPLCTYIAVIDNGADVIQLALSMLLSEVFALFSLYSLRTEYSSEAARAETRSVIRCMVPLTACWASLASFLIQNGLDSDPFSLNSFFMTEHMLSMSWWGISGVLLFIFCILSQIPYRNVFSGTLLLLCGEGDNFRGAPRGILQIWSVFRSFIIVALTVYVLFPSNLLRGINGILGISWHGQALNFVAFWLSVSLTRILAVPLCRRAISVIERPLPQRARGALLYVLVVAAMALLWYEGVILSQEAAAY